MIILKEVKKAFWRLYKNPLLFIPDLAFIFLTWIAFQILLPFSGINTLIEAGESAFTNEVLLNFYQNYFFQFLISLLIFTFVTFIFGAMYQVIKYNMIKEVIKNKPSNLFIAWKKRKIYFWRVVSMKIYVFLISIFITFLLGLLGTGIYLLASIFTTDPLTISTYIGAIIALLVIITVKIGILFRYPALFLKSKNSLTALKNSIKLLSKKPKFVIGIWFLIITITLIFTLMTVIFHGIDTLIQTWLGILAPFFSILFATVFLILELIPILWTDLFLFSLFSKLKN